MGNSGRIISVALLLLGVTGSVFAGNAVSGPNGKVGFFTGDMDGGTGKNFDGSFSFPLGTNFGAQVDGIYTDVADRDFYGVGGHLFWRNPEIGLLGITGGAIRENDILDSWAAGIEGEYYLGKLTFSAQGGAANIDYTIGPLPFIETDETGYQATGSIGLYPLENLLFSMSYTHALDNGLGRAQIEYQTPLSGFSIFGELAMGDHDYDHAMLGVRYYLGKKKSLIRRHREDDPKNMLHGMLYTIGTYGAEFNKEAASFIKSHSTPPESGPGPTPPPYNSWDSYGANLTVTMYNPFIDDLGKIFSGGTYPPAGSAVTGGNLLVIANP